MVRANCRLDLDRASDPSDFVAASQMLRMIRASCFNQCIVSTFCHRADVADEDLPPAERARRKHEAIRQNIYRLGPYLAADSRSWRVELLLAPIPLRCGGASPPAGGVKMGLRGWRQMCLSL